MTDWQVQGTADLERLAVAYREGGRKIRARAAARLRETATPLAREVIDKGSDEMPEAGGMRARMKNARARVTVSLLGQRVSVSIPVKTEEGYAIRAIDRTGEIRHPVYGNRNVWRTTQVKPHAYTDVFKEGAPVVSKATAAAVQEALAEIAREASSP